jgi:hypothetical protein
MERKMQDGTYSYRAASFEVKYLGATNHSGSRVKIYSHHLKKSRTIGFNYRYNCAAHIAIAAVFGDCEAIDMQAPFITYSETKSSYVVQAHFDDAWEIVKKFFGVEG